ncbi:uncharacterized protein LOC131321220 [Rhododendron vialii]|uniref:uncharacterized protein LOC131321220 n=1 Tax=Rhododendron vialii TaxID=182163 RepID=UPI00265F55CD|nr:uncharacterized protein LOC131321220 [Rhododendron vialii]
MSKKKSIQIEKDTKEKVVIVLRTPVDALVRHLKPLYIMVHINGQPINKVLIDNGAIVNILPSKMMKILNKNESDLIPTEVTVGNFAGGCSPAKGINKEVDGMEIFWADKHPFKADTNNVEAGLYDEDLWPIKFDGSEVKSIGVSLTESQFLKYITYGFKEISGDFVRPNMILRFSGSKSKKLEADEPISCNWADCVVDDSPLTFKELTMEDLEAAPAKLDDYKAEVKDPLEDFNVGTEENPRILHICAALPDEMKDCLKYLLFEFKDCFAWDYPDMPGLNRSLVEHKIPIKEDFVPYQQIPRQMTPEVQKEVKKEIERLFKAKFIRPVKYVEWISNIVPVIKKNGKIFIAEEDTHKTAFRCPGYIGLFEWIVMAFGLKNAGATYRRTMNVIFHDLIGRFMEVYIDDIVVKSHTFDEHVDYLRQVLMRMRQYKLKMNAMKCAFGVTAGNFLGFLVHKKGIEVDKDKAKAIIEAQPPTNKQELQQFLGQVNFFKRFISNLSGKTLAFFPLLKLKSQKDFKWKKEHQKAFEFLKQSLVRPPILMPPIIGKPLKLYISAGHQSIGCLLAQDNENGHEQAIYYLSKRLNECEIKYKPIEKLCLTLYFSAIKLRCYMLPSTVHVIAQTDIIKYILTRPILRGKQGKWLLSLIEYDLQYVPQKAVKGQVLADFVANHPNMLMEKDEFEIHMIEMKPWKLSFDGSKTDRGVGAGIVFTFPKGEFLQFSFQLDESRILTNNQAEYEALIIGLEIAKELNIRYLNVMGDSQLVIR